MRIVASVLAVIAVTLGITLWIANKPGMPQPQDEAEPVAIQNAPNVSIEDLDLSSEEKDNVRI